MCNPDIYACTHHMVENVSEDHIKSEVVEEPVDLVGSPADEESDSHQDQGLDGVPLAPVVDLCPGVAGWASSRLVGLFMEGVQNGTVGIDEVQSRQEVEDDDAAQVEDLLKSHGGPGWCDVDLTYTVLDVYKDQAPWQAIDYGEQPGHIDGQEHLGLGKVGLMEQRVN